MRPLLIALVLLPAAARADWLVLLDTTDRHGHLDGKGDRGGAALLGGYLANARKAAPGRVLLLDSGDLFQGTMVSNLSEGHAVVRAMNQLGYDAAALGNHEFDFGPAGEHAMAKTAEEDPRGALKARAHEAKFPLLSANINGDGVPWKRWTMLTAGGVRVGVVGGTSEDLFRTTIKPNLTGLRVDSLSESVSQAAAEARRAGAGVVVAVVHAGGNCPRRSAELTAEAPGDTAGCEDGSELFRLARELQARAKSGRGGKVDALFGGHTHKALTAVIDGLPLAQPMPGGSELAEIDVEVVKGKATGRFRVRPNTPLHAGARYLDQPVVADAAVDASFAEDTTRAALRQASPVGVSLSSSLRRAFDAESPMGNLLADLLRQTAHADLGLTNGGGLRADLPAGPLSYGALFEALPFDNKLATVEIDGATIRRMLTSNAESALGIFSISGGRVSARCTPAGLRVELTFTDGRTLDDARRYRVATNDFMALGGDDFGPVAAQLHAVISDEVVLRGHLVAGALPRLASAGVLRGDDARFWDPAHPRMELPTARPVRCPN